MQISKEQLINVVDKLTNLSFGSYSFACERVSFDSLHSGQRHHVVKICPHSGQESLPSYHVSIYRDKSSISVSVAVSNHSVTWVSDDLPVADARLIISPLLLRFEEYESFCLDRFLSE